MSNLTLPVELWSLVFGYLHLGHIIKFLATCKYYSKVVRRYILFRRRHLAAHFFRNPDRLFRILYASQAVISGSCALYLLQPLLTTPWFPHNMDIFVSQDNRQLLLAALATDDYQHVVTSPAHIKRRSHSPCHSTITLMCSQQTIHVVMSPHDSAIFPVYRLHSTILINFITHDSLCCSYPQLTLRRASLINPFLPHDTILNRASIDSLLKYRRHGFSYFNCYHIHGHFRCFKHTDRKLNDKSCMWVVTKSAPFAPHSRLDTYARLGIVNAHWRLGGELCTTESFANFAPSSVHIDLDSE